MRFLLVIAFGALLFAACTHRQPLWPDESTLIDQAMAPPTPGEAIPEGVAMGGDAPPLAPVSSAPASDSVARAEPPPVASREERSVIQVGTTPVVIVVPVPSPNPPLPQPRMNIQRTPHGTVPGMLP